MRIPSSNLRTGHSREFSTACLPQAEFCDGVRKHIGSSFLQRLMKALAKVKQKGGAKLLLTPFTFFISQSRSVDPNERERWLQSPQAWDGAGYPQAGRCPCTLGQQAGRCIATLRVPQKSWLLLPPLDFLTILTGYLQKTKGQH